MSIRWFVLVLLSMSTVFSTAQEFPPLLGFSPKDYQAENQNWSISQSDRKVIYVANNKGLLSFNGSSWKLYESPNQTILRSIHVVDSIIYSGSYMDFGYWKADNTGTLRYTSLKNKVSDDLIEDEQFWSIQHVTNSVVFQSLNRIYIYDALTQKIDIVDSRASITKMYKVDGSIYFQDFGHGIYKIENGTAVLIDDSSLTKEKVIINMFNRNNKILFLTQEDGFYETNSKGQLDKWNVPINSTLNNVSVYNSISLNNGGFAIGTIAKGVFIVSNDGKLQYNLDYGTGLQNNTVLNLYEDIEGNIWLALDNGINCINLTSPFRIYNDPKGVLGSVYASAIFNEKLYLGTNQGLFYKDLNQKDEYTFIENTNGQVWFLEVVENTLFCGHNNGTYVIDGANATMIAGGPEGTWLVKNIPNQKEFLLQGNYSGIHVLEKRKNRWQYRNKIEGFDISSRHIAFLDPQQVLINHEYKGIYDVTIDDAFSKVINIKKDTSYRGLNSDLINYKEKALYAYEKGVFEYDAVKDKFVKNQIFSQLFDSVEYTSGKLIFDTKNERLWGVSKSAIHYLSPGISKDKMKLNSIFLSENLRNTITSYESILPLSQNIYLIGTSFGYITLNLEDYALINPSLLLDTVEIGRLEEERQKASLTGNISFDNKTDFIRFELASPVFRKFFSPLYRYRLVGLYDEWSTWSDKNQVDFENLPHGEYAFVAQIKTNDSNSKKEIAYSFKILKPWYLSSGSFIGYLILFILLVIVVNFGYKRYYKKKQEREIMLSRKESEKKTLEAKQKLVRLENERLQQDIETRNKELASSTMNILRKNEILVEIKNALKSKKDVNISQVIKLIDKNLTNTGDWELFQEAFNNADKDFIKEIKEKHPVLTSNDLRLCAYLRLNLSSKEIAPLLNISPRSVEVKRYRLRKKLNLSHESSLADYILSI